MLFEHTPVLLTEVIDNLNINSRGIYVDCTVGGGGHALEIARRLQRPGLLVGLDRDPEALRAAQKKLVPYQDRIRLVEANYRELQKVMVSLKIQAVNGVIFDLGVSSYQLDNPYRGFSYMHDAPLDMRMGKDASSTAHELVNNLSEEELEHLIREYGEERWARRIASFIIAERQKKPVRTTGELVKIIKSAIPHGARQKGPHPAKRTFQALRIAVNDELDSLTEALEAAVGLLLAGGRICVISFHSLEDRIVKRTYRRLASACLCPPRQPVCTCGGATVLREVYKKPVVPASQELENNPRARSAKLRVAEKIL